MLTTLSCKLNSLLDNQAIVFFFINEIRAQAWPRYTLKVLVTHAIPDFFHSGTLWRAPSNIQTMSLWFAVTKICGWASGDLFPGGHGSRRQLQIWIF